MSSLKRAIICNKPKLLRTTLLFTAIFVFSYYFFIFREKTVSKKGYDTDSSKLVMEGDTDRITSRALKKPTILKNSSPLHKITSLDKLKEIKGSTPNITLVLRLTSAPPLMQFSYCTAFRSISIYWAKELGNVGLILDKESQKDHEWAESLKKHENSMGIKFSFYYEPPPKDKRVYTKAKGRTPGYNRQLYSSYIMDLFIKTPILAWTDTDGKFTTPVTKENIIKDGKLMVKGMNMFKRGCTRKWDMDTRKMIGKPMISDFMTYFPVYIWTDTIKNCRNHILKYMNVSNIEEAYLKTSGYQISPVNMIMTYAYYYEQDRYDWHLDIRSDDLISYNKNHAAPGFELQEKHMTPDMHVSVHEKYYRSATINKKAYCETYKYTHNELNGKLKEICAPFVNTTFMELFEFCNTHNQEHLTTWCKDKPLICYNIIKNHYKRVEHLMKLGFYDLDLKKVRAVDRAAKDMNITCPPYFKF